MDSLIVSFITITKNCQNITAIIYITAQDQSPEINTRVIGGNEITHYQVPYLVSTRYDGYHRCGGSVISESKSKFNTTYDFS